MKLQKLVKTYMYKLDSTPNSEWPIGWQIFPSRWSRVFDELCRESFSLCFTARRTPTQLALVLREVTHYEKDGDEG